MPVEPPPTAWDLRVSAAEPGEDLVGVGADLEPGTILAAYRAGMFPMGLGDNGTDPMGWWCPDPRGVLLPGGFHASRSLRRSARSMEVRVDTAFADVVRGCAAPQRRGRWITPAVLTAYTRLHELGWAHSVEVWQGPDLVGGLYGLAIGGLFAGESMFHRATDASKVAVWALTDLVFADGDPCRLIDVQWRTRHLATLGVVETSRADYLARLERALLAELPPAFA
ncbi:MAG TPA: leucyl/phenylalanyl-tRNA--protein transferase [Segeticoccus sp.]|uniref:leucyl/phenylalanyl-tRNA--protein transferase n=1 Tax=Segeticoccus sp. TaxID=2706531 RepID=UPI002D802A3F|nr:leucyl/phenylalanyl-tRNA--protein transferase [Segeticoccus sp.]HET8600328.1 leucyl/phenylalanyl-tRNA--protein transferase [Segeticoccus sp.]